MKLLVIGASGQVARALAGLQTPEVSIVVRGRPETDLRVASSLQRALETVAPEVVINAAAYTAVDRAEQEPEGARAVNSHGPGVLARLCERNRLPLIHLSTDYVFDGTKSEPYLETDPTAPINTYGRTKAEGEARILDACSRSLVVRTSWIHGAIGRNFVTVMLGLGRQRSEIPVVDDQHGSPTYAPHLAHALVAMARRIGTADTTFDDWGIHHAAGSGATTWCGLAREIFAVADWLGAPSARVAPVTTAEYPTPARRPANSRLDCTRLERVFGLRLPAWQTGVALAVGETVGRQRMSTAA